MEWTSSRVELSVLPPAQLPSGETQLLTLAMLVLLAVSPAQPQVSQTARAAQMFPQLSTTKSSTRKPVPSLVQMASTLTLPSPTTVSLVPQTASLAQEQLTTAPTQTAQSTSTSSTTPVSQPVLPTSTTLTHHLVSVRLVLLAVSNALVLS